MSRFKGRPMDGLPGRLPAGEQVLWQGKPDWRALARHGFHIRLLALYFAGLVAWRIGGNLVHGHGLRHALLAGAYGATLAAAGLGLFGLFAWLIARTSTYTITQKRIVLTYGMALPKSLNLPFAAIQAADLKLNTDGTGDIAIALPAEKRLSLVLLWPHVRVAKPNCQPVLRCIRQPEQAAEILGAALARSLATTTPAPIPAAAPALAEAA